MIHIIIEHDSDDLLLPEEKQAMFSLLWEQYQLVGKRIYDKSLAEKKIHMELMRSN